MTNPADSLKETPPAAPAAVPASPTIAGESLARDFAELEAEASLLEGQATPASATLADAAAAARAEGEAQWAALVRQLGKPASDILAPAWGVTEQEWAALGQAWAPILQEQWPDTAKMGPWPGAILCTAMVVAPRIGMPMRYPPRPAEADAAQGEGAGNG